MFRILRVTGESLSPDYLEGDYVVLSTLPLFYNPIRVGDVLVFKSQAYGILIKRVESIAPDGDEIFVVGSRAESIDSRSFGPIRRASITGKVIWHIRKPGRMD